ncbi:protein phosphatase 1 regulatory subunit 12B isoform X2 [Ahaetulla prasina]|uniref:protein phosphatase 1 regulatory subunit 12B isoform X2 n=1 Tax=Ahaetulla prasina TaxID=499056 RepID=UPI0026487264|nr:protein phosphatase 1 regulatory subunit 12B isoform X2 [Ahaetulla prasina]
MSEPGHLGIKRAESARLRRAEQLKRWKGSLTELEPVTPARSRHRGGGRVRFEDGAVFLAACSSGDTEEVKRLLARGARLNTANVDGLTALHQACIDENLDMVKFLVEYGANVNQQDNEGWTPLHAVASCGYLNIAEYLINHGANVAAVNSEGEVPADLAEEAAMKDLLLEQVKKQGVDLDQARKAEEQQMLQDARQWLNRRKIEERKHPRTGATALHVASAKGYCEVMRLLIQAGFNVNVQDNDGWTPLHAAAHWGVKEACTILAEALCDMDIRNKLGQTPFDVADEGLVEHLEMLQKKQNMLRSEESNKLIEADMNGKVQSGLFKNKEKIIYEADTLKSLETEEENKESSSSSSEEEEEAEEDEVSESDTEKEAESKEESIANHSNHESRILITEQIPPPEHNTFTMAPARKCSSLLNKPEEQKDESPSSWRLSLRKTSSQNALSEDSMPCDTLKEKGSSIYYSSSTPRISALLDNQEKDKDNRIYFASISPRRLNNTGDIEEKENRESAVNLVRSGPYSRQQWREEPKGNETPTTGAPSTYISTYMKSASFGRSSEISSPYISANRNAFSTTSSSILDSSTSLGTEWQIAPCPASTRFNTTTSVYQSTRAPYRQQSDSTTEKSTEAVSSSIPLSVITNLTVPGSSNGVTTTNSNSLTGIESSTGDARDRRRSYLTPVRDEEAESLRKARSRQARQTRRSTQGITLTDLQEAERTFSRSRAERLIQEQPSERSDRLRDSEESGGKQEDIAGRESREVNSPWTRNLDEESSGRRLRYLAQQDKPTTAVSPSLTSSLYSSSHMPKTSRFVSSDSLSSADYQSTSAGNMEKNEYEDQDLDDRTSNKQSVRERRRPKERRRGTGISFFTKDDEEMDGTEEVTEDKHERLSRLDSASSGTGTSDTYSDRPSGRTSAYTRRAALSSRTEDDSSKDYKKLYESALSENQKLKSKLQDAQAELADIKSKMDKLTQKQEKTSDRSSMLEMEKREKRVLERKLSEMEEEMKNLHQLKQIHTLRQMNEQLLAENRALTRVVARLSQSAEPPESEEL